MSNETLAALHTALLDAEAGYEKAIEKAEDPRFVTLFREMHALHGAAHHDVHGVLTRRGERTDESGSFMGSVNKAVVVVRAAITGLDENALSAFASGEANTLERYDEAISAETDRQVAATLRQNRDKLAAKVAQMEAGSA